jgi:hypothetical protein
MGDVLITLAILESLLHYWIIDIREDFETLQVPLDPIQPRPLHLLSPSLLNWDSAESRYPIAHSFDFLQFLLSIRKQSLPRFLEALVWELFQRDV